MGSRSLRSLGVFNNAIPQDMIDNLKAYAEQAEEEWGLDESTSIGAFLAGSRGSVLKHTDSDWPEGTLFHGLVIYAEGNHYLHAEGCDYSVHLCPGTVFQLDPHTPHWTQAEYADGLLLFTVQSSFSLTPTTQEIIKRSLDGLRLDLKLEGIAA